MKNAFLFSILSLSAISTGWTSPTHETRHIECSIEPIVLDYTRIEKSPRFIRNEDSSSNWSGYVAAPNLVDPVDNSVDAVTGTWIVPQLSSTSKTTYSAFWVGIDGYTSSTVEQIGTSHDWVNGKQKNYAWFEMYPQGPYQIVGFPVHVGDHITGQVTYVGDGVFQMTLTNKTRGVHTEIPVSYTTSDTAQRSCAEWIVEAPASNQGILPLAKFGSTAFGNCATTILGMPGTINSGNWVVDEVLMTGTTFVKAKPSSLINSGKRFSVAWKHQ